MRIIKEKVTHTLSYMEGGVCHIRWFLLFTKIVKSPYIYVEVK